MRFLKKVYYKILIYFIKKYDGINNKKYMKKYAKVLKRIGMNISPKIEYIHSSVYFDGTGIENIYLGDYCVVSKDVIFLTHDFSIRTGAVASGIQFEECKNLHIEDKIVVKNNVFIGMRAIILPGTTIEDNVIIGAGAVVKGYIPSNSVVVGNPSKIVNSTVQFFESKYKNPNILNDNIF